MDEFLEGGVVDVCSRTFVIYSNEGDTKKVKCDTTEQFMDVLDVVLDKADPSIVKYAEVSVEE